MAEKSLKRNNVEWIKVTDNFFKQYSIFLKGDSNEKDTTTFLAEPLSGQASGSVEVGLRYTGKDQEQDFSSRHVETLLNQASDLLDRCLHQREELLDARRRALSLALEVLEFRRNDAVLEEEIKAGKLSLPAALDALQVSAHTDSVRKLTATQETLQTQLKQNHSPEAREQQVETARSTAWSGSIPSIRPVDPVHEMVWSYKGQNTNVPSQAISSAERTARFASSEQKYALDNQATLNDKELSNARYAKSGAELQQAWDESNIDFQVRRIQVSRDLIDLKIRLATQHGGPFNFSEIANQASRKLGRDLNDALARIAAIRDGLLKVYKRESSVPDTLATFLEKRFTDGNLPSGLLDDAVFWVRETIAWLVRFAHRDQTFTLSLSLRAVLGENWKQSRKDNNFAFDVSRTYFGDRLGFLRLRGVSAIAKAPDKVLPILVQLECPAKAANRYKTGVWEEEQLVVPPVVYVGRVASPESNREPEFAGTIVLHNLSPVGRWRAKISAVDLGALEELDDLHIEFAIASRIL